MITTTHLKELEKKGYTVIENVLSNNKCDTYINKFWDWLEGLETGIDRNKPETWKTLPKGGWPMNVRGIIKHYKVGHSQFVWDIRCEPNVIKVFQKLWNEDELLVSFDAVNIMKSPALGGPTKKQRHWYHTDQGSHKKDRCSIQGFVTLEDVGEEEGSLMVLPKSHKYHQKFFKKHNLTINTDWYKLKDKELEWFLNKKLKPKKVLAPKGSMILWDSRVIHCNCKPTKKSDKFRYVIYVCMTPKKWCDEKNIKKRIKAFEELRMTSHWPHDVKLVGKNPQLYGMEMPNIKLQEKLPELSDVGKKLVGYDI